MTILQWIFSCQLIVVHISNTRSIPSAIRLFNIPQIFSDFISLGSVSYDALYVTGLPNDCTNTSKRFYNFTTPIHTHVNNSKLN